MRDADPPRRGARRLRVLPPPLSGWMGEVWDSEIGAWRRPAVGAIWRGEDLALARAWAAEGDPLVPGLSPARDAA